jgi:hypothetical protein
MRKQTLCDTITCVVDFPAFFFALAQRCWDATQAYVLPVMMVGMVFLGPAVCRVAARMTRSLKPRSIKSISLLAACGAMVSANWVMYQAAGEAFTWYAWLPDFLFVLAMLGWLRTPMVHLRAGSADGLDDKIERLRPDGWDTLIYRWIPSTGVHRVLLTKRG